MKKILCYGDSNTYGYNPNGPEFDNTIRWTALLQKNLGNDFEVINEGLCDRTGFVDNDKGFLFSAQKHFPEISAKIKNLDILVLWIGTNDLQYKYNLSFRQIENGLEKLIITAKNYAKRIIIIPPVVLTENVLKGYFNFQFDETSISKSKKVSEIYIKLSRKYELDYFDINEFTEPSKTDGLHYDKTGHKIIADKLAKFIEQNSLQTKKTV